MSQAEELLNSLSKGIPTHSHPVPDTDTYFIIDPITRKIENTNRKKTVIMQYDHNSERFTFELPRYVDGHDMLECTSITVNVDNIETETNVTNSDASDITDLRINPNNPEKVISSWLISRNSTQLAGILSFSIEYKCVDTSGNVVYEWSTDIFNEVEVRARKKNGEAAVIEHTDLLEQWRSQIFGAGDSVMANIAAEGEAQVEAVKTESENQQEAVELKGSQTLDSIPEDYTKVDAMADEAVRSKADAIVCETSGETIMLNDSSNNHIRGMKLFGKSTQVTTTGTNLLNATSIEPGNSGTVDVSKDGRVITIKGSAPYCCGRVNIDATAYAGQTVYYSGVTKGNNVPAVTFYYINGEGNKTYISATTFRSGYTLPADVSTIQVLFIANNTENTLDNITTATFENAMLSLTRDAIWEPFTGGMPSPTPYYSQEIESIDTANIYVYGKNLFDLDGMTNEQFIKNDDGTYTIVKNGTSNLRFSRRVVCDLAPGEYTLSVGEVTGTDGVVRVVLTYKSGREESHSISANYPKTFVATEPIIKHAVYLPSDLPDGSSNIIYELMLERGTVATKYEPHKHVQIITIPRNLPGIPVSEGGNYTDENGQQWICDEVDLERGVLVKRCDHCVFDGSDDEVWDYEVTKELFKLSYLNLNKEWNVVTNTGRSLMLHYGYDASIWNETVTEYGYCINFDSLFIRHKNIMSLDSFKEHIAANPIELTCVMSEPIETPLTAEEITAFKALKTNYPNTTILNDAGAWMSVKYNADTKTYVENPKILKLTDSSTGVVYELKIVDGNLTVVPI